MTAQAVPAIPLKSYPPPKERDRSKPPAHQTVAVRQLERKYQQVLGRLKHLRESEFDWVGVEGADLAAEEYQERENRVKALLEHLESAIRTFDPEWGERKRQMRPIMESRRRRLPFQRNSLGREVIRVLSNATEPMTVPEIARKLAVDFAIPMTRAHQRNHFCSSVRRCLISWQRQGCVACLDTRPARWFCVSGEPAGEGA